MMDKKEDNYLWLSPLILLIFGIFSFFLVPTIPIASGFGWDGIFYGKVALNFQNIIGDIDSYHAGRIFPGILIYYTLLVFKAPLTLESAITAYKIYYLIILTSSGFIWVKISNLIKLHSVNAWLGFICIFISYPVLNWYFYYSPLTDGTTLFVGLLLIYCYLKPSYILLFLTAMISFFSWPTGIIMSFSIFIYGKSQNVFWSLQKYGKLRFLTVFLLLIPLLFLVFCCANLGSISLMVRDLDLRGGVFDKIATLNKGAEYDLFLLFNSILLIIYFIWIYWLILKDFDFKSFFRFHIKKEIIFRVFISMVTLVLFIVIKNYISNPFLPTVKALQGYAYPVIKLSTRFPLQFLVSHISFWGPSIFLLIFYFNRFLKYLKSTNLAIMVGFIFTVIFSINAESRAITNFYPFIIFILIQIVDFSKLKRPKLFLLSFLIVSIIYSKIWLQITLPGTIYPDAPFANLDKFPLQWYFMNFGLWMNYDMYFLHLLSAILLGVVIIYQLRLPINKINLK